MNKSAARLMQFNEFLIRNKDDLDPFEYEWIRRNMTTLSEHFLYYPFVVREIYDKLGFMSDDENLYVRFAELLRQTHNLSGKRILEVGAGVYPTLGEKICTEAGIVVAYDPRLTKKQKSTDKLKLVRRNFNKRMCLDEYDLVVSLMPCKAAEDVLDACIEQDKDFVVGLCEGGPHGDCYDFYEDDIEWRHSIMSYADSRIRRNGRGKVLTKQLDGCNYPYPIIYNSRN